MPVLPPTTLAWTIGAVGAAVLTKLLVDQWRRVNDDLNRIRAAPASKPERSALPTLRRDPATGVYRPWR